MEKEEEEQEEEEERLPRCHGRWALASSPGGPAQTSQGSPPSYFLKSKTDLAAHLRTLFPAGHPGLSAGERQRYGPIYLQLLGTNRPKILNPPELASQNRPAREGVGLPGHHPRLMLAPGPRERGPARLCALPAGGVPPVPRVRSHNTIRRIAGGLGTPGLCECGTCVTATASRCRIAAKVTDDAWPQRPSPNDEPYDACTEAASE